MPQEDRARKLLELLKWISQKKEGATTGAVKAYTRNEITRMGATDRTIENYIETLKKTRFMEYKHPCWHVTNSGRRFLEQYSE